VPSVGRYGERSEEGVAEMGLSHRELEALLVGRGCPACDGYPLCRCRHACLKHRTHLGTDGACSGIVDDPCACPGYAPERPVASLGGRWEIDGWLEEAGR